MVMVQANERMREVEQSTAEDLSERGQWSNKVEFLLTVTGNMVGLGNLWRFPYLCFKNGGGKDLMEDKVIALNTSKQICFIELSPVKIVRIFFLCVGAFLIPYILFAVTCGVPLFVLDICIGQYTKQSAATSWGRLCPLAEGLGHGGYIFALYTCISYNIVLAWALFYLIASFSSLLPWIGCGNLWNTVNCVELVSNQSNMAINRTQGNLSISAVIEFWEGRVLNISPGIEVLGKLNWELFFCLLATWVACYFCTWKGVKSTGKAVYFTAIFPYVMLLVLLLRGLTLPGALQGIKYYLYPQPSRLTDPQVWIDAATQIFFSYSLASGVQIVLGSYSHYKNNSYRDSIWLCVVNSGTSFAAGFVVFSVLGFMAEKLGADIEDVALPGPGLAFITYPQAVAMMPLPQLWSACFFIMFILLVLDSQFVGIELFMSSIIDIFPNVLRRPYKRELFLLFFCTACFCFQILLTTQGGVYIFQLIDYYGFNGACYFLMCLIETLVIGWSFGADRMSDIIEDMCDKRPSAFFKYCWCYFTPLMCLGSFIFYLARYTPLMYNSVYIYPDWAYILGWLMSSFPPVLVITWGVVKLVTHSGTLKQSFKSLCTPDDKLPLTRKQRAQLQRNETPMTGI
ncbi:sodium- and chloride-dependent GABA transporter 2-like isoform X2 [Ictalurus furcatus]|uniref:sodium- and chloride-dependent GABA transporter 2-like isoform X2 n=1 Tax=Ictalurus furcatus TaxID=66913 RepID=UPI002350483D|nr:sodium- and chloride-dependent GABA transporter 2-like isoform X2 [Ictalurus furcatus]